MICLFGHRNSGVQRNRILKAPPFRSCLVIPCLNCQFLFYFIFVWQIFVLCPYTTFHLTFRSIQWGGPVQELSSITTSLKYFGVPPRDAESWPRCISLTQRCKMFMADRYRIRHCSHWLIVGRSFFLSADNDFYRADLSADKMVTELPSRCRRWFLLRDADMHTSLYICMWLPVGIINDEWIARTCNGDVAGWLGGCPSHAG